MVNKTRNQTILHLLLVAAALFCLLSPVAKAQLPTGDIVGTVDDSANAAIPGAKVTAQNRGTGEIRNTVTNESGDYVFTLLQIGTYSVTVEAPGFKTTTSDDVPVGGGTTNRVDVTLVVGSQDEKVEVTSAPPAIQTDSSGLGGDHQ